MNISGLKFVLFNESIQNNFLFFLLSSTFLFLSNSECHTKIDLIIAKPWHRESFSKKIDYFYTKKFGGIENIHTFATETNLNY